MDEHFNTLHRRLGQFEAGREETDSHIASAATWLADNWHVAPQPVTRTLREMFGLKFNDAVRAMVKAKAITERQER